MAQTVKEFYLGVAGEAQQNQDGVARQKIIKSLKEGAGAELRAEPDNAYDKDAVGVWVNGQQIGYVPRDNARLMARDLKSAKTTIQAWVHAVNCAGLIFRRCGVVLRIRVIHTVKDR